MKNHFSYGKQTLDQADIDAVVDVLRGDWLTQGPKINEFEEDLSKKFGASYVSVVSSGTAGLHLIGLALGWGKKDIILTSPITFLATANCILYVDAIPDFVDIDPLSYTIDVDKLEEKLIRYSKQRKKIKAVIAVDYAGHPCDWVRLRELANLYDFQLVNDNCHALGAEIDGDIGYACKFADVVNMSFHPVKHITTGEGGAILTNRQDLDEKVKMLRTHGVTKSKKLLTRNDGPWYYEMHELGFNYRITDFQCALGSSQLKKLENFVSRRNAIAEIYNSHLGNDEKYIIPSVSSNVMHAYHLYPLQIKFDNLSLSKIDFFSKMKSKNIHLQVHYIPVHIQPYYKLNYGFKEGDYPISESLYNNEVSIPIYPSLNEQDLEYVINKINETAY